MVETQPNGARFFGKGMHSFVQLRVRLLNLTHDDLMPSQASNQVVKNPGHPEEAVPPINQIIKVENIKCLLLEKRP